MHASLRAACWLLIGTLAVTRSAFPQAAARTDELRTQVEALLTNFHDAAADADGERYFGCLREDAILLGSAPGERFTVEQFRALVQPGFAAGQGWKTVPYEQNVGVSADGTTAWFDERLHRANGAEFRVSGVLRRDAEGWKLVLVNATFPVPNERVAELAKKVRGLLPRPARSIPADSEPAAMLDAFHRAGREADLEGYLGYLAQEAVILGSDVGERFTREQVRRALESWFASGQGLETELVAVNATESEDGRFAWFDARLDKPSLCEMRGSGLLRREADGWKLVHYDFAFVIPNGLIELVTGPSPFRRPVDAGALREDFALLRRTLEEWHPALYVYESQEEIDRLFDETLARVDAPMTPLEFETLIGPVVARVHCSHTRIQLRGPHYAARMHSSTFLPVDPQVIDGRLWVRTSYVDQTAARESSLLVPGTELLEIDGRPARAIINQLVAVIPADGHIRTLPLWELNWRFHLHYATHFGSPERFALRVRTPGSDQVHELSVPALSFAQWRAAVDEFGPRAPGWPLDELETQILPDEDLAILLHPNFRPSQPEEFSRELEEFFVRIGEEGIGNLIVDLRPNAGGDPERGSELVSYLTDEPYVYFRLDPEQNSVLDALALRSFTQAREPAEHFFHGRIFVLIGGRNTSTAGHVLSLLDQQGRVVLIGEESGATWTCNDNSKEITLPATNIRVKIARTTYQAAVTGLPPGVGVQPDHVVQRTVEDMLGGRDPAMDRARRLARESD